MKRMGVLVVVLIILSACGGGSDPEGDGPNEPGGEPTTDTSTGGEPSGDGTRLLVAGPGGIDLVDLDEEGRETFIGGLGEVNNLRLIAGTLWFVDGADLVSADAGTGELIGRVSLPNGFVDLAVDGNIAWVLTGIPGASGHVEVIDTETMTQLGSITAPAPTTYLYITAVGGEAWVFGGDAESATSASKLDSTSFVQSTTVDTGILADSMAAGEGRVWIGGTIPAFVAESGNPESGIVGVDPGTGEVPTTIQLGEPADHIVVATGFGHLWATKGFDGTLYKIDPATGEIVDSIDTGDGAAGIPLEIIFTNDSVWVFNTTDDTVTAYDPDTLEFQEGINVPTFAPAPIFAP